MVTDPDGTPTNYSNLSSIAFTASKQGWWTVRLTATDNEGDTAITETGFLVGTGRTHGRDGIQSCHGNCGIDPGSGAGYCVVNDPAITRGHPLANSLSVSTQGNFRTRVGPAGNFHFSYGMFVDETTRTDGVDTAYSHLFLVDGDGKEIDLGRAAAGISQPAYMFSDITATSSGFTVENAGAPGQIESRGNFTYHFDLDGKLLDITDPQGNVQTVSYNTDGTPSVVTDVSTGKTLEFEYDTPGIIARFVENGGAAVTHLTYDTSNRVTDITVKDSLGTTVRSYTFSYDSAGRLYQTTRDGLSSTTATFSYRKWNDDVYTANLSWSGGSTNFVYSAAPPSGATFKTTRVNAKSATTTYEFDARYNLLKVTRPIFNNASAAPVTTMTYNANDTLATSSDGAVTYTYTTNSYGLVTRIDDSGGKYVQYTYSGADLTKVEDNIGTRVEYQYGNSSQPHVPTAVLDGLGRTWSYTLNAHGQVTQVTPPSGSPEGATVFSYDETTSSPTLGMLMSVTNGNNESTVINSRTALGDPTSISTFPSTSVTNTTDFEYDATQRMTKVAYSDGKEVDYTHNGRDLASVTDEAGTSTSFSYCPMCSALTGQSEPLSRNLSWSLDADFDMTSFTDPRSYVTTYVLGNAKEVKQIQYPDSITHTLKYDNYGRLKSVTNQRGNVGTLTYDSSAQVTSLSYGTGHNDDVSYTYFADGSINTITSRASVITYTYTGARQVASVSFDYSARGLTPVQKVEYTYYADGKINTIVWKNGTSTVGTWTYTYDAAGRISSVSNSFGESASYTYDGEGKILTQTNGNGTSTEYVYYEPRGWVSSIAHKQGSTAFQSFSMEFDSTLNTVGNITKVTELSGDYTTYTYDALSRLTGEARTGSNSYTKTYGYDVSGNLTTLNGSTFATYDSGNKLSTLSGGSVAYDGDGNMTTITGGTSGVPSGSFGWNAWNRIGQQKTSSITVNYVPDGLGRRGYYSNTTTGDKRYFVFHGDLLLGEVTNSAANRVAYTWGPDGLVSERLLQSSSSRYYHFGPQGETRALTNGSGTVTDTNLYTAYGVPMASTGSSVNHHQFGGKHGYYSDGVTGSILATNRWYQPHLARWLTRDPIGYEGGLNLYEYVHGRPTYHVDPSGKAAAIIVPAVAAPCIVGATLAVFCYYNPDGCRDLFDGPRLDDAVKFPPRILPHPVAIPKPAQPTPRDLECSRQRRSCEEECWMLPTVGAKDFCLDRCIADYWVCRGKPNPKYS